MKEILKKYVVKSWQELTPEEKEAEKKKNADDIYYLNDEMCWNEYKWAFEELKNKLKYFSIDDIYFDDNSQGWWLENYKKFELDYWQKEKHAEDFLFTITQHCLPDELKEIQIDGEMKTIEEWQETKGYKKLATEIKKEFDMFAEELTEIVTKYFDDRWNLTDEEIEGYFEDMEFEFFEGVVDNE